jgi:hypothetical protein
MPAQQTTLLTDDRSAESRLFSMGDKLTDQKDLVQEETLHVDRINNKLLSLNDETEDKVIEVLKETKVVTKDSTAPLCYNCGNQTQRSGSCYVCTSCGSTTGCS